MNAVRVTLLFVFSLLILPVMGQISIGFYIGGQKTQFTNNQVNLTAYKYRPTYGWNAGFTTRIPLGKQKGLYTFPGISYQGQKYANVEQMKDSTGVIKDITSYTRKFDFAYLKLPIAFYIEPEISNTLSFFAFGGPQLAMLLQANYILDGDTLIDTEITLRDKMKPLDLDFAGGLGINVSTGKQSKFFAVFRFDVSLLDAEKKEFKPQVYALSKNLTYGINFGYEFMIGTKEKSKKATP